MAKAAGGELHTGCEAELGVAGKLGVGSTVLEKVLEGKVSLQRRDEVLGRDTVACARRDASITGFRTGGERLLTGLVEENGNIAI